jgi:hypothetical protein
MPRVWKKVKRYERWVLIGVVIILIATFSVTGATRSGCTADRGPGSTDHGGSFQVAPGRRESISDEDWAGVYHRYWQVYASEVWGPSLRFGGDMMQARHGNEVVGTWMHIVAVKAAEAAGYAVGEDELREGVQEMVVRITSGGSSLAPRERGTRFTPELYDQVIAWLADHGNSQGHPITRAEFEQTVREILLKDKFLGDLVALQRHSVDRFEAFDQWKPSQQRIDLAFASVPGAQFKPVVELEETTRSAVAAQTALVKKLSEAGHKIHYLLDQVKKWKDANKALPADTKEFLDKEPAKSSIGKALFDDPWGKPYTYEKVGDDGRIASSGPDGKPGSADDVTPATVKTLDALGTLWQVGDAVARWHTTAGVWPTTLADLLKAPPPATGQSPIAPPLPEAIKDPWDHEFAWDAAGKVLSCSGPDGAPKTADDLVVTVPDQVARDAFRVPWPAALSTFVLDSSKDAWGRPLSIVVMRGSPLGVDVFSAGADGVAGNEDDVKDGNEGDLAAYYSTVKSSYGLPLRREFEALYVIPCLVSDETLAAAWNWKEFKQYQPDEKETWDSFRLGEGVYYKTEEDEADAPASDPKDPSAPKPTKGPKPISPDDKTSGYGASLLKTLREKNGIPKDATGWQVPAETCFGDKAKYVPTTGLPSADKDAHFRTYLEKGWRLVVLRDQFFDKLLAGMLKKSRDSKEAHDKYIALGKTGADTPLVTFAEQLAECKDLQPGANDASKGARFLQLYADPGKALDHDQWEKMTDIGSIQLSIALNSMKDDEYAVLPKPLGAGDIRSAIHSVKQLAPADQPIEAVREKVWPKYVEWRALDRAARELDRVRADLVKPADLPAPSNGGAPPAAPEAPAKPDGEARAKALVAAVEAAGKKRGFTFESGRTGLFVAETARGEREPKPSADADEGAKAELLRRSYVRHNGYDTVKIYDAMTGSRSIEPGAVGRTTLKDQPRHADDVTTGRAYLVVVAAQQDPAPEEFNGKEFLDWVGRQAFDETPEWSPSRTALSDRKGTMLRVLYRLYDDWDSYKQDYKIETNTDLLMPKGAGKAR